MALLIDANEFFIPKPKALISPRTRHFQKQQQEQQQQHLTQLQDIQATTTTQNGELRSKPLSRPLDPQLSLETQLEIDQSSAASPILLLNKKQCRRMYWLEKFNDDYQKEHQDAIVSSECECDFDDEDSPMDSFQTQCKTYDALQQDDQDHLEPETEPLPNKSENLFQAEVGHALKFQKIAALNSHYRAFKQTLDNSPRLPLLSSPPERVSTNRSDSINRLNMSYARFVARARTESAVPLTAYPLIV